MRAVRHPEFRDLVRQAISQGWRVEMTAGGHWIFLSPDRSVPAVVTGSTPSSHRWLDNLTATLRRRGLVIGTKGRVT